MNNENASFSIDAIFKSGLTKMMIGISIGLSIILTAQAFFFSYQTQNAVCAMLSTKVQQFGGPLGREIALGDTQVAGEIFNDFRRAISGLGAEENLQIDFSALTDSEHPICKKSIFFTEVFQPIYFGAQRVAAIRGSVSYFPGLELFGFLVLLAACLALALRIWRRFAIRALEEQIISPIKKLSSGENPERLPYLSTDVQQIAANFQSLKQTLLGEQRKNLELERRREISEIAMRVAHDIRSPLSLIGVISGTDTAMSIENKQLLIAASSRIDQIASDLLKQFKAKPENSSNDCKPQFVFHAIEKIVSEKRALCRDTNLEIHTDVAPDAGSILINLNLNDFERTISNLLVNSLEAMDKPTWIIDIKGKLADDKRSLQILISDNGHGISAEKLSEVGKRGVSFKNGNGIGVHSAIEFFQSIGGELKISSKLNVGTTVELILPVSL